jgi:O-antigen/teichoic acid export membrane protein
VAEPTPLEPGRLRRWVGILTAFFASQGLAQLLSMAAGLLFVREMAPDAWALYALALSVLTAFSFLSDLGANASLLYFAHRCRRQGEPFDPYRQAVRSLRLAVFALGAPLVALGFPAAALAKGFSPGDAWLTGLAILPAVAFQILTSVQQMELRLDGDYARSYRADVAGGALRFGGAGLLTLAGWLPAWPAVASGALGSAATVWVGRRPRPPLEPPSPEALRSARRAVLRYLLPTLPSGLYFALQGQLMVWFAAAFGSTESLAEVGALSRLGLLLGLFSSLIGVVFLPRLAVITDDRLYLRRTLAFGAALLALALGLLAGAWLLPELFLAILGPHYRGLGAELLLVVAGSGLTLLGAFAVAINAARSWNRWQGLCVAAMVAGQAAFAALLPLSTTAGVLRFQVASAALGLLLQLVVMGLGFARPRWVEWT